MPLIIIVLLLAPVLGLVASFHYDVAGLILFNKYPFADYEKIKELKVGMEKAEVEKMLGSGVEKFVEDEDGRRYTSFYKTKIGRDITIAIIEYDNDDKLFEIYIL